jgi:hypothetical protein
MLMILFGLARPVCPSQLSLFALPMGAVEQQSHYPKPNFYMDNACPNAYIRIWS